MSSILCSTLSAFRLNYAALRHCVQFHKKMKISTQCTSVEMEVLKKMLKLKLQFSAHQINSQNSHV